MNEFGGVEPKYSVRKDLLTGGRRTCPRGPAPSCSTASRQSRGPRSKVHLSCTLRFSCRISEASVRIGSVSHVRTHAIMTEQRFEAEVVFGMALNPAVQRSI